VGAKVDVESGWEVGVSVGATVAVGSGGVGVSEADGEVGVSAETIGGAVGDAGVDSKILVGVAVGDNGVGVAISSTGSVTGLERILAVITVERGKA
jgi:hypothetical protein